MNPKSSSLHRHLFGIIILLAGLSFVLAVCFVGGVLLLIWVEPKTLVAEDRISKSDAGVEQQDMVFNRAEFGSSPPSGTPADVASSTRHDARLPNAENLQTQGQADSKLYGFVPDQSYVYQFSMTSTVEGYRFRVTGNNEITAPSKPLDLRSIPAGGTGLLFKYQAFTQQSVSRYDRFPYPSFDQGELVMEPNGVCNVSEGDAFLPVLLRPICEIGIERIEFADREWEDVKQVLMISVNDPSYDGMFGRYRLRRRLSPLETIRDTDVTMLEQVYSHKIKSIDSKKAVVSIDYKATTEASLLDREDFNATGKGEFIFDREQRIVLSYKLQGELKHSYRGSDVNIPFEFEYSFTPLKVQRDAKQSVNGLANNKGADSLRTEKIVVEQSGDDLVIPKTVISGAALFETGGKKYLATVEKSKHLLIVDRQSQQSVAKSFALDDLISLKTLLVSNDGRRICCAGHSGVMHVFAVEENATVKQMPSLVQHASGIESVYLSDDGKYVASIDRFGLCCVWELESFKLIAEIVNKELPRNPFAIRSNGSELVFADREQLRFIDLKTQTQSQTLKSPKLLKSALSSDGRMLLGQSYDSQVVVWNTDDMDSVFAHELTVQFLSDVGFSPDSRFAYWIADEKPWVYDTQKNVLKEIDYRGAGKVRGIYFDPSDPQAVLQIDFNRFVSVDLDSN